MGSFLEATQLNASSSFLKGAIIVAIGIIISLSASGVLFGWSSLLLVLQSEGVYHELCTAKTDPTYEYPISSMAYQLTGYKYTSFGSSVSAALNSTTPSKVDTCVAQDLRFNLVYMIPVTTQALTALPFGAFLDWKGSRLLFVLASIGFAAGHLIFAFGTNTEVFDGILIANTLIMYSGGAIYLSLLSFGQILPKYSSSIMGGISLAFDSSTFIWYLYMTLYKHTGLSIRSWFLGYLTLPGLYLVFSIFWPKGIGVPHKDEEPSSEEINDVDSKAEVTDTNDEEMIELDLAGIKTPPPARRNINEKPAQLDLPKENSDPEVVQNSPLVDIDHDYPLGSKHLHSESFWNQIRTKEFLFLTIFHCMFIFWLNGFIGSAQSRLDYVNPTGLYTEKIISLVEVLGLIVSLAFVIAPVFALVSHNGGPIVSLVLVCVAGTLWSIFQLIISRSFPATSLNIQIGTFILFSIVRAFYFSMLPTLIALLFGWKTLGKIYGLMGLVGGPVGLLFYPLMWVVFHWFGGNFMIPNIVQLLMMIMSFAFAWYLYQRKQTFISAFRAQ